MKGLSDKIGEGWDCNDKLIESNNFTLLSCSFSSFFEPAGVPGLNDKEQNETKKLSKEHRGGLDSRPEYLHVWVEELFVIDSLIDVLFILKFVGFDYYLSTDCVEGACYNHECHDCKHVSLCHCSCHFFTNFLKQKLYV